MATDRPGPSRYGNFYYCVKTNLSEQTGEIYVLADHVRISEGGFLGFYGGERDGLTIGFASGSWQAVYLASGIDGSAVAVDKWEGEVTR